MKKLDKIFQEIESTLKKESSFSITEFESKFGEFKKYKGRKLSDNEIYQELIMIMFYSGFRASTVENKRAVILNYFDNYEKVAKYKDADIIEMMSDKDMIKNEKKIRGAIKNANTYKEIIKEYKSFNKYLDHFDGNSSFENLMLLKEELQYKFEYLGGTTVYHFLTDLGYEVLKPDKVIKRIFKRLG